jgi:hypothetical protein
VEKRAIDKQGFIEGYFDIYQNIKTLETLNYSNVTLDLVVKDATNKVGAWYENISIKDIDDLVNTRYTKDELERRLKP